MQPAAGPCCGAPRAPSARTTRRPSGAYVSAQPGEIVGRPRARGVLRLERRGRSRGRARNEHARAAERRGGVSRRGRQGKDARKDVSAAAAGSTSRGSRGSTPSPRVRVPACVGLESLAASPRSPPSRPRPRRRAARPPRAPRFTSASRPSAPRQRQVLVVLQAAAQVRELDGADGPVDARGLLPGGPSPAPG